jgi:toxin ParE1/3/4
LVHIAAWYADRHPTGETRFFRELQQARDLLAQHPRAGRERDELRDGLRSWPVHPYLVFYVVDDDAHAVVIERVIHGHTDIDSDDFEA